jgi:hypothetical protein
MAHLQCLWISKRGTVCANTVGIENICCLQDSALQLSVRFRGVQVAHFGRSLLFLSHICTLPLYVRVGTFKIIIILRRLTVSVCCRCNCRRTHPHPYNDKARLRVRLANFHFNPYSTALSPDLPQPTIPLSLLRWSDIRRPSRDMPARQ